MLRDNYNNIYSTATTLASLVNQGNIAAYSADANGNCQYPRTARTLECRKENDKLWDELMNPSKSKGLSYLI